MPIIVEDGTGLADADSYVSVEDARSIAAKRGIVLTASDVELESQLVQAADRLNAYEDRFMGMRTSTAQALSYPRTGSFRFGSSLDSAAIPRELKLAQVQIAGMLNDGLSVWYDGESQGVKSETISVLSVTYADTKADSVGNPDLPQIEAILIGLFAMPSANFILSR